MGMAYRCGRMVPVMRGTGSIIKLVEKGNSGMWMGTSLKDNGRMTRQMAMECTFT